MSILIKYIHRSHKTELISNYNSNQKLYPKVLISLAK
jgi:hypothetical protein